MTNIYQFEAELLDGKNKSFADYEGEVLLIVNTASKCGFTPQFAGLEKIYEQYHAQGFEVLGFPCNQFGGQDPGSNEQIGTYCQKNYGVTFPMFSKVDVKGPEAHAIFRYLTNNSKGILGSGIKWNFTKFLIGKDGKVIASEFTHCIVAIGIVPNTENIGLEALGVEMDRGFLKTDPMCRTNVPGLWAIGDITAPPWLAHKASHEGVIAAEAIAGGHPHAMDPKNIPGCTYCHPQVASVGLTEAKAKEAGYDVKVGNFPFLGNGKAIALGEAEGFIKTVFDAKTGELLGAHMVGAEVTELIQGYTIGKTAELVEADFMHTVFPHPTLSEMMHESVLGAYGKMLHM